MQHKHLRILAAVALSVVGVFAFVAETQADSATAVITVSATVKRNCLITTTPLAYGAYDPVGANATAPLDATGTVSLTCTRGTTASIGLDAGANASGSVRRMTSGGTAYLTYDLYLDTGRTTVWTNATGGMLDVGAAPTKDPRSFTVYGRVPGAQDVPTGTFNDSVVATVNF
jgi:spore coat protein U-like protein